MLDSVAESQQNFMAALLESVHTSTKQVLPVLVHECLLLEVEISAGLPVAGQLPVYCIWTRPRMRIVSHTDLINSFDCLLISAWIS